MNATLTHADAARALWTAFRGCRLDRSNANVALDEIRQSLEGELDVATHARYQADLRQTNVAYDEALAALKAFYAEHYGEAGTTVLGEFFAAETDLANITSDHARFTAYGQSELFSEFDRRANGNVAAHAAALIPAAQTRLDQAQTALDALTGVRVN